MAEETGISWATSTFNPWIGCTKVSAGCENCYAETLVRRWGGEHWGPRALRRRTSDANWRMPLRWNRKAVRTGEPWRVFCSSLADVFDNRAPDGAREDLWALIRATPALTWMLLTKRPGNIAKMLPADWEDGWPNVWLGVTAENQLEADRRIPHLVQIPAALRFLSCEPLLGPLDVFGYLGRRVLPREPLIEWVICGGESGHRARPMHPDWARSLRDQCAAAGVPFHFKQWGAWASVVDRERDDPDWRLDYSYRYANGGRTTWLNAKGGCGFHGDRFHVMGKARDTGRLLDGAEHQAVPA